MPQRPAPHDRQDLSHEEIIFILDSDLSPRDQLLALGWDDSWMYGMDDHFMRNILTQMRFTPFLELITNGLPIGESGNSIAAQYYAGMYFNDFGVLTVLALPGAFIDAPSLAAIEEMHALGILVHEAHFTEHEMDDVINQLSNMHERVWQAGSSSWGRTATQITMWIDPYTPEQIVILSQFLTDHGFNLAMFAFEPQITDDMRARRIDLINEAANAPRDLIAHIGEVTVARTGIAFSMHNRTDYMFNYGSSFDLARYENGQWIGVDFLQGRGGGEWSMELLTLQSGGIDNHMRRSFEWRFGELEPGHYLFIIDGWLGDWQPDQPRIFALVEFEITNTTPHDLPIPEPIEAINPIVLIDASNPTPTSITLTIKNQSPYDIDHIAHINSFVREEDIHSPNHWDWWEIALPRLPIEGEWEDISHFFDHGQAPLPAGQQLTFTINWEVLFGSLDPGAYRIVISTGGRAHPPHPWGWLWGEALIIPFTIE